MGENYLRFSSLSLFLKGLMDEHKGKYRGNVGRLAIAVHGVFIDCNFILSDESKPLFADDGSDPSVLRYSIPDLAGPIAIVEFATDGDAVTVSGCLSRGGERSDVHRVCFDIMKTAAALISSLHGAISDSQEMAILEFWAEVRSKLSVPLRIDICYQKGIFLPPCFLCLPGAMQADVVKLVAGFDDAVNAGCRCAKLGFLCKLGEIWGEKFEEKFGPMSCRRREFAVGWLRTRIEDGDYAKWLYGINIDELNEPKSYSAAATVAPVLIYSNRHRNAGSSFSLSGIFLR